MSAGKSFTVQDNTQRQRGNLAERIVVAGGLLLAGVAFSALVVRRDLSVDGAGSDGVASGLDVIRIGTKDFHLKPVIPTLVPTDAPSEIERIQLEPSGGVIVTTAVGETINIKPGNFFISEGDPGATDQPQTITPCKIKGPDSPLLAMAQAAAEKEPYYYIVWRGEVSDHSSSLASDKTPEDYQALVLPAVPIDSNGMSGTKSLQAN